MLTVGWEVDTDVLGQKVEHLALRPEFSREGLSCDLLFCLHVHDLIVLILILHDFCDFN